MDEEIVEFLKNLNLLDEEIEQCFNICPGLNIIEKKSAELCVKALVDNGYPKEDVIPSFYVDTRFEQEIIVNWRINGADIPEAGINGKLKLTVKNKK